MDAKCRPFAFECIRPFQGRGTVAPAQWWWVSSPLGCVSIQKHLPLADGLLLQERDDRATRLRRSWSSPTVPVSTGRAFRGLPGVEPLRHCNESSEFRAFRGATGLRPLRHCNGPFAPSVPLFTLHSSLCTLHLALETGSP